MDSDHPNRLASRPGRGDRSVRCCGGAAASHVQHRFLTRFAVDAETDASVVMRALLTLLAEDAVIARRILRQVAPADTRR